MQDNHTISVDAMGGDYGPEVTVSGAALALKQAPGIRFVFFGDSREISRVIAKYPELSACSEVVHTSEVIENNEKPSVALRSGRNTSMRLAINAVQEGRAGAVVSGGNTGALMALAKFVLKTLPGVQRPAIASTLPTMKSDVVMLDLGANVECDAGNLVEFAILGSVFARLRRDSGEKPSVGLLNVGTEDMKGKENVKEAGAILRDIDFPGNFFGFIEGNDIPKGTVDVVVTDGFTGNVALKVTEGMGELSSHFLKEAFLSSLLSKIGGIFALGAMRKLKSRFDPRYYNGGVFIGLNGICVKSHGRSDAYGFSRAVILAHDLASKGYISNVAIEMRRLAEQKKDILSPEPARNAC